MLRLEVIAGNFYFVWISNSVVGSNAGMSRPVNVGIIINGYLGVYGNVTLSE